MRKDKKEISSEVSDFLNSIANLLIDTERKMRMNIYPHDNCAQMEFLKNNLINTLKGKMEDSFINQLSTNLSLSTKLEMLYNERKDPETLQKLQECAGMFRALSLMVQVK